MSLGPAGRAGRLHKHDHVMNYFASGAANLGSSYPAILFEVGGHGQILIGDHAIGGHVLLGDGKLLVRRADAPAFGVFRQWRQIFWITFASSAINPGHNGINRILAEPAIIEPLAMIGIRMPGGHSPGRHFFPNRLRPWPRLLKT